MSRSGFGAGPDSYLTAEPGLFRFEPCRRAWPSGVVGWHCTGAGSLLGWRLLVRGVVLVSLSANLLERLTAALVGTGWLYVAGMVALGFGLILTYARFRAAPIVPGEQ